MTKSVTEVLADLGETELTRMRQKVDRQLAHARVVVQQHEGELALIEEAQARQAAKQRAASSQEPSDA